MLSLALPQPCKCVVLHDSHNAIARVWTAAEIDDARLTSTPKASLAELIVGKARQLVETTEALIAQCDLLDVKSLAAQAKRTFSIDCDVIDEACDEDAPKAALTRLLVAAGQQEEERKARVRQAKEKQQALEQAARKDERQVSTLVRPKRAHREE